jgi:hypothetical protein
MHIALFVSTPYRKYRAYFSRYYRRYYREHPEYRERQKEQKRIRYRKNRETEVQRTKGYIAAIYRNWFGERPRDLFGGGIALAAEKLAIEKILPKEGFKGILWAQSFGDKKSPSASAGSFWMFDAFAIKDHKKCAIQITTSPVRQMRNRASVSAFLKFFSLTLYVCTVNPDMKRYYIGEYNAEDVPHTVMMTAKRVSELKSI